MNYETHTLKNGISLIHYRVPNLVAHLGLLINTGSRDESEEEHGLAHFVEHMLFKGTKRRKAWHIISRMEDAGGEINAYTTKEETCLYTSFMKPDYPRALELLQDIFYHSVFPEKEIVREQEVIIDEINSYMDNPGELIFDDFEELLYGNHPIARNILGTPESLRATDRNRITAFIEKNYCTDETVICSVGDISFKKLTALAQKYFGDIPASTRQYARNPVKTDTRLHQTVEKNTFQIHSIIGNAAYPIKNENRIGLHLLNNILGGPGLNSRLNMTLREKNGYSYHTESHYSPYSDTGILDIYFSGDKSKLDQSRKVIYREFARLRNESLGSMQLSKAKKQLMGQIAISSENNESLMLSIAKSYLVFNKVDSLDTIAKKIDQITAGDILRIANEILEESKLSSLTYI